MKHCLLAILSGLLLTSCAGVHVKETYVATGAVNPEAIYIRPFGVQYTEFKGLHRGGEGERAIRKSLAPREFAECLKEELEKLAPAMIIEDDEMPKTGWLVEGELDVVDAGSPGWRAHLGRFGVGRSHVQIHVRVIDVSALGSASVASKNDSKASAGETAGKVSSDGVIYAFTLSGGSGINGERGTIYAPGLGYATPFDFRNAAERVMLALSVNPYNYGTRVSPTARY